MPVEFLLKPTGSSEDTTRLVMMYDGSGRRISKTLLTKSAAATGWDTVKVTHYTGIGTEIREEYADSAAGTKVVVPMPQGLGRYGIESAVNPATGAKSFEWYLKNHLGSTMLVYGTTGTASSPELKHAYDYRSFGEQIDLTKRNDKVTENFTGKEKDDETELNYFGARYLDPMLGIWTSVDPARQFVSPYLYAGNGYNPINGFDSDGLLWEYAQNSGKLTYIDDKTGVRTLKAIGYAGKGLGKNNANWDNIRGGKNIPNSGPLPAGKYTFAPMIENYVTSRGVSLSFTMQLIPDPENEMFGRSGFLAHGDNSTHTASDGCLIFDRAMRKAIDESGDRALQVVPDAAEDMDPEWFGSGNVTVGDPIIEQE